MSVTAADIVLYSSANMPESDSGTSGGAIDLTSRVVFTDISTTDNVTVISDAAGDNTQTVTVYGRTASGTLTSEVLNLDGTNRVTGGTNFERIMKVVVSATHAGVITVTRDNSPTFTVIAELPGTNDIATAVLTIRRMFYGATANASGGADKDFYEKFFIKNMNAINALLGVTVIEETDGVDVGGSEANTGVTFDVEDAQNDTNSVANRLSAPSGMNGTFTSSNKSIPGTDLGPGDTIGVWLKLTLADGELPNKYTYTVEVTGSTT